MPQVFQVLKCYKCFAFQIHQTKKSNKFDCKICGEKQSIKRHYGIGTGKDCRLHVQKLNILRANSEIRPTTESNSDEENESKIDEKPLGNIENSFVNPVKRSKWSEFIDKEQETEATAEPLFLADREVLEIPQKKKTRKFHVKAKANNSDEYPYSISNTSKAEFKSNLILSNNIKINCFESKNISVQDDILKYNDTSTTCKIELIYNNFGNQVLVEPREHPVVLQTVNKNSKWAQYVDTEGDKDLECDVLSSNDPKECVSNPDNLFSLCDDSDLDQVLDI